MELLRQHGLYGGGLIDIDNPLLVGHYNDCLKGIGIEPTRLSHFQIDGRGWSPEIATEKQNSAYLSHGGAVQYAILLSPDQIGKPIYQSYFSFERALLAFLFRQAGDAIARITKSTGLWLQMNPGFSEIQQIADLTMIGSVTMTLGDPQHLVQAAEDQRKLVAQFVSDKDAWLDEALRRNLTALGHKFGDLRFAASFSPSYRYIETQCFYVPMFGGSFVLRNYGKNVIVVGDQAALNLPKRNCWVSSLKNRSLLARLLDMKLLEIPIEYYRKNPKVLEKMREQLLVESLYAHSTNGIDFASLNEAQRERYVMEYKKQLPRELFLLERLERRLANNEPMDTQKLPLLLKWLLARPTSGQPFQIAEVLWKLICRVTKVSVITQFAYDKEKFFGAYGSWPEARQRWSVETILKDGLFPRRHS